MYEGHNEVNWTPMKWRRGEDECPCEAGAEKTMFGEPPAAAPANVVK